MSLLPALMDDVAWMLTGQVDEDQAVRDMRIDSFPFTVGRHSGTSMTLDSPTVSSRHAELDMKNGRLTIRDLNSTNGTFVNGIRIQGECDVMHGDLVQFAQVVFRAGMETKIRHSCTVQDDASYRALALIQFDKLMTERAVAPHFQPIVDYANFDCIGYEVLGRSRLFGLTTPGAMFTAAAVLDLESELSRILRSEGIRNGLVLSGDPILFVNTHPAEMSELGLLVFSLRELREIAPESRIVLEIHEAAVTDGQQMAELRTALTDLDIGLAYDDFGAGQARLIELVEVPPDYLKFDLQMIRNIHQASTERQKMLQDLVKMVQNLGVEALAEGVELAEEDEICRQMGFNLVQGFYHGRPALPKTFGE